jgi:hypothetical protein
LIQTGWYRIGNPVSQQNTPVTIAYPEMVAKIFPYFKQPKIPEFGTVNLWFL